MKFKMTKDDIYEKQSFKFNVLTLKEYGIYQFVDSDGCIMKEQLVYVKEHSDDGHTDGTYDLYSVTDNFDGQPAEPVLLLEHKILPVIDVKWRDIQREMLDEAEENELDIHLIMKYNNGTVVYYKSIK